MPALASPAAPDAVRIQLVFGADVDLDLYVTGPAEEAVYFANDASRTAAGSSPTAAATRPRRASRRSSSRARPPGRYRVGVDFMIRCARGIDRAPFELIAEAPGGRRSASAARRSSARSIRACSSSRWLRG